ncbi:MAG: VCBS repeat-containing protein, partial [Myxococcota bacterium]
MRIRGVLACCVLVGCAGEGTSSVTHAVIDGPFAYLDGADVAAGSVRGVTSIDVGDLSGDGNPDVVVLEGGRHAGDRVTFAWFEAPSSEGRDWTRHEFPRPDPFRPFVGAAKVGDVDGDGDQDVVVSMDNHSGSRRSAYIYWLENDGADWRVQSIARDLRAHHINDMELTDLDDDGRLDVIVRALEPNELRLYFQDASGWTERILDASPYGGTGEGFSVGDIDRRGAIDITICGHWLEAPSDPRRENYRAHDVDADFKDTNANVKEAVGDINGDGRNDVVLSPAEGFRGGGNHVLAWYEAPSDPTGRWTQHVVERDFNGGHVVRLLDFDGDGDLDLLSGVAWSRWGQTANITLYPNRDGAFGSAQVLVSGQGLYNVGVGDIGRDGDLDFVGQDTYSGSSRP